MGLRSQGSASGITVPCQLARQLPTASMQAVDDVLIAFRLEKADDLTRRSAGQVEINCRALPGRELVQQSIDQIPQLGMLKACLG